MVPIAPSMITMRSVKSFSKSLEVGGDLEKSFINVSTHHDILMRFLQTERILKRSNFSSAELLCLFSANCILYAFLRDVA